MARPSRSQIISAQNHTTGKIEKWPLPDLKPSVVSASGFNRKTRSDTDRSRTETATSAGLAVDESGVDNPANKSQEGFEAGYLKGMQAATLEIEQQQQQLSELLQALDNPMRSLSSAVSQELIQLALDIARCVVQKEIEKDQSLLAECVSTAVSRLPVSAGPVCITAHPDELARLKKIAAPALSELSIQWVEDPSTQSGCFSVSRENSLVDGGIEAILNSVLGETKLAA